MTHDTRMHSITPRGRARVSSLATILLALIIFLSTAGAMLTDICGGVDTGTSTCMEQSAP